MVVELDDASRRAVALVVAHLQADADGIRVLGPRRSPSTVGGAELTRDDDAEASGALTTGLIAVAMFCAREAFGDAAPDALRGVLRDAAETDT